MIYAGIGSRSTPLPIIRAMENIALRLAMGGHTLRSGAAKPKTTVKNGQLVRVDPNTDSADQAFERSCKMVGGKSVIRVATLWKPALDHAAQFHPNWSACDEYARALHGRNSLIMLGDTLDQPVDFVVCWTDGGAVTGGTGQALRIAAALNIPVCNLATMSPDALWAWLAGRSA